MRWIALSVSFMIGLCVCSIGESRWGSGICTVVQAQQVTTPVVRKTCCEKLDCPMCITETQVIAIANEMRARAGRGPLARSAALITSCRMHSARQASSGRMFHGSSNGVWSRENVAMGQDSPASVMNSWMNSSGHRANILSNSNEIGVAKVGRYWTLQLR